MDMNDAMRAALNYALGYIAALAGWAETGAQRDSASEALDAIETYIQAGAQRPIAREQDEREQEARGIAAQVHEQLRKDGHIHTA